MNEQPIEPKYKKDNGIWVLDIDAIAIEGFEIVERSIVHIPAGQVGGNHRHPRIEAFMALGSGLNLYWLDENETRQETVMKELTLYTVPSNIPHAVMNGSNTGPGFLLEFANEAQHDVVPFVVV